MTEAAITLIQESSTGFLLALTLFGLGYGTFYFGKAILTMLKDFLNGLLEEIKGMVKSITDLGAAEKLSREETSKEHKVIIDKLVVIHRDLLNNDNNNPHTQG